MVSSPLMQDADLRETKPHLFLCTAENYYTADYPEDEVDTEDEFDRHAYMYRNANASDEEEFDDNEYDSDEIVMEGQDDDDDDARMDRIREFMQRNAAFRDAR